MNINRASLSAFFTGLNTAFQAGLGSAQTVHGAYAMPVPSTTSQEMYAWMATLPGFREWIGDRVMNNIRTYDYTIKNKKWEDSFAVKREELMDDQIGLYGPLSQMMGQAGAQHPQELVDALLLSGFSTNCYDGQYFFDTDHPVYDTNGALQTVSNFQGGSGPAWFLIDDSKPLKPIVLQTREPLKLTSMTSEEDEAVFMRSEYRYGAWWRGNVGFGLWQLIYASKLTLDDTAFAAARSAMRSMSGDGGRKLNLQPGLCLVGPSNEDAANKLFNVDKLPSGGTNPYYKAARVVVSNWLQ
jgi:phage major head subunit gpT-like protein